MLVYSLNIVSTDRIQVKNVFTELSTLDSPFPLKPKSAKISQTNRRDGQMEIVNKMWVATNTNCDIQ